ncbi:hypothetical protein KKC97_13665, partial [bacterium]|nr:hypothetical protein [bacterium]
MRFRKLNLLFLLSFSLFVVEATLGAGLDIRIRTAAWGGSCDPGPNRIIAGSNIYLICYNDTDDSKRPLEAGWPEGYTLEAALDYKKGETFFTTVGLLERLNPTPYKTTLNFGYEALLQEDPGSNINTRQKNSKAFALHIPDGLVGHTLTFRALYNHRGQNLVTGPSRAIKVIEPCDEYDQARIVASWIYGATHSLDYDRAIHLADSMIENGLTDLEGWYHAKVAAQGSGRIDKLMDYYSCMWEDYGVLDTGFGEG